jgi:hypothetical protein
VTAPQGIAVDVVGADGSVWPLLQHGAPAQLVDGITGLFSPRGETQWVERRAGRRRQGRKVSGRSIRFRVMVGEHQQPGSASWLAVDNAWWTALGGGDDPFTLRVTSPGLDVLGRPVVRTLRLWDESEDEGTGAVFSAAKGKAIYTITAEAEAAYWSGPAVRELFEYQPGEEADYYGGASGTGYGPPFVVGGGSPFSQASISNPGDVEAYARWTVTPPFSAASVGLPALPGGQPRVVPLTFSQVSSQQVVIETDPDRRSITDGRGTNLWPLIRGVDPLFPPIPARTDVALAVTLDQPAAGSAVEVVLVPQHRRAW